MSNKKQKFIHTDLVPVLTHSDVIYYFEAITNDDY